MFLCMCIIFIFYYKNKYNIITMSINYKDKYLKYKEKYLELKNKSG